MDTSLHVPRIAAVLLAAGESTRMGEPKALLPWASGKSLLAHQVSAAASAKYDPIIVVLGHFATHLRKELRGTPAEIVENQHYREGRSSSIVIGLKALPDAVEAVLIMSVDQPRSTALLKSLHQAWEEKRAPIVVPGSDNRKGHPPLFSASLLPELLQVTEEREGLREVLANHQHEVTVIPTEDPLVFTNLNTRQEYEAALRQADS